MSSSNNGRGNALEKQARAERRVKLAQTTVTEASYTSCNADTLVETIESVGRAGGALRFGRTRDGGALCIGIYGDGSPYNIYVRPGEDLDYVLARIAEGFESGNPL